MYKSAIIKGGTMPRRTKEEAAETRERILEAALHVFSKKGYSRTTFVDIAREIGLSKGAVYWHFKTKTDLLAGLIQHGKNMQCGRIKDAEPKTVAELRELVVGTAQGIVENDELRKFEFFTGFQIEWSSELLSEVHARLIAMHGDPMSDTREVFSRFQQLGELNPAVDVSELVLMIASFWVGALNLMLSGKMEPADFPTLLGKGYDQIIGIHAIPKNRI
jgi:TetR/AcrR family acrAB operon transcriptional repressor